MKTGKRSGQGWRPEKPGSRPSGDTAEGERVRKWEEELSDVESRLDSIGDPWDAMNIDEKKKFALHLYYSEIKVRHSSLIDIILIVV